MLGLLGVVFCALLARAGRFKVGRYTLSGLDKKRPPRFAFSAQAEGGRYIERPRFKGRLRTARV